MVPITALWLPILVAAALVFLVSSIFHTALTHHDTDFAKTPDEDAVRTALRSLNLPPGDFMVPYAPTKQERGSEEFTAKMNEGPLAMLTVFPPGPFNMGRSLVQWFLYCVLVSLFAAYVAGAALAPGSEYLSVFRIAGAVAFAGYSLALFQNSIWFRRKWSATLKSVFDGLIYGLLTAGVMGWLWPGV